MGSGRTSRLDLSYPIGTDPTNVPGDVESPLVTLDGETVVFLAPCTLANLPAASSAGGRVVYVTDAAAVYYDAGSPYGWIDMSIPVEITTYIYGTGSWTPPLTVASVDLIVIGGGGGGGGGYGGYTFNNPNTYQCGGGGGGAGEYAQYLGVAVTGGAPCSITIGSGGAGGTGGAGLANNSGATNYPGLQGSNGNTTTFGAPSGSYSAIGGGGGGGTPGSNYYSQYSLWAPRAGGACTGGWGGIAGNLLGGGGGGVGSPSGMGAGISYNPLLAAQSIPVPASQWPIPLRHLAGSGAPGWLGWPSTGGSGSPDTWRGGFGHNGYCAGGAGGAGSGTNPNLDFNPAGLIPGGAGMANTGNGGGGGGGNNAGGNGGSGLVIVRYVI